MLRKFPYPFRNMLTILSDADSSDQDKFEGMHRFINTLSDCGNMGQGVGLDISDTFFMGLIGGDFAKDRLRNSWYYWETKTGSKICASQMQKYMKGGWIDTPHTFFNFVDANAYTKEQAVQVIEEWNRIGFQPIAWVDHSNCPWNIMFFKERYLAKPACPGDTAISTNIVIAPRSRIVFPHTGEWAAVKEIVVSGKPVRILLDKPLKNAYPAGEYLTEHPEDPGLGFREGAVRHSGYYCADLARQAGIKAFWARMPSDISRKTAAGKLGFDTCLVPKRLPDNRMVWGLLRNYEYAQTNNTWLGKCINRALSGDKFSSGKPISRDTYLIIATHFGYGDSDGEWDNQQYTPEQNVYALNGGKWFNDETIQAFRALKIRQDQGEILVTRTSRLIKYNLAHDMLTKYAHSSDGYTLAATADGEKITIHKIKDDCFGAFTPTIEDVRGITFYCKEPSKAEIWITDKKIDSSEYQINKPDHTGQPSIGIKWYPPDTQDYVSVNI